MYPCPVQGTRSSERALNCRFNLSDAATTAGGTVFTMEVVIIAARISLAEFMADTPVLPTTAVKDTTKRVTRLVFGTAMNTGVTGLTDTAEGKSPVLRHHAGPSGNRKCLLLSP